MALVCTAFEHVPRVPYGHDRFEIIHPLRDTLVQLEMELIARYGDLTNIEVISRDTETGQERVVRAAHPGWPAPDPTSKELEKVRQNRLSVLRAERTPTPTPLAAR